ncbi:MAG TPA: GNAT family N-acetyltransferase [Chthoniobacterales bacterium]|nr:GNAT family N-acetyltransferase [Chthoniobacterales bacterium]
MREIEIIPVRSRAERDAFIKFPWRIYARDPAWVPPLLVERKQFLDREKHPFYQHGDAALFLARSSGEIVGRIMASDDPKYNALHQSNAGCFGMFESIDDQQVANALFDAAAEWLRQLGRDEIMGPIDYSTNYLCGLLIDGFQFPPTLLTSHNPPYYSALLEGGGFEKAMDLYAWWLDDPTQAATRLRRVATGWKKRSDVTIRPARLADIREEARKIREIYNQAWRNNWGFVPFSESEFEVMTRELKPILVPELVWLAEIEGNPVGFVLCVPDINVALRKINGRLTTFGLPIGLAKLLYHKSRIKTVRLVALGVLPKFRRNGIAEMLVLRTIEEAMIKRGFVGEASLILESNVLMNRFLEAIGLEKYKTYRIYRRGLDGKGPE